MSHVVARDKYEYAASRITSGVWQVDAARGVMLGRSRQPIGKPHSQGYISFGINMHGRVVSVFAHRVIWESVHGPIGEELVINHINGDKTDNRIANLEVITQAKNTEHARLTGLTPRDDGYHNTRAALGEEQVVDVRRLHHAGHTIASIAEQYNVSKRTVRRVINGERYQHAA